MTHDELRTEVLEDLRRELGANERRVSVCVQRDSWRYSSDGGQRDNWIISALPPKQHECMQVHATSARDAYHKFRAEIIPALKDFFGIADVPEFDKIAMGM